MTSSKSSSNGVKSEKKVGSDTVAPTSSEDRALDDWARTLVNRPTPQIGQGQGNLGNTGNLSNFLIQGGANNSLVTVGSDGLPPHNGYDVDSAIGKFTWCTIGEDKFVPCVYRCKKKYCSIRMAEISLLGDFLRALPVELYECLSIPTHNLSLVEAKLLGHVNTWHCDGFYGPEPFTTKDQVAEVTEIERFYNFLQFAFNVLSSGGRNEHKDFSKCAFLKVNSDNLIPYTVLLNEENEKGVPLFYFEGQTDILKEKAVPLTGWELAYLKVCCKVQGVRKDLIAGPTLQIVRLSDLKSYFPKRTIFTDSCWPEAKMKSLLSKASQAANQNHHNQGYTPPIPSSDKWTKSIVFDSSKAPKSNCNGVIPPAPATTSSTTTLVRPTPTSLSTSASNSIVVTTQSTVIPIIPTRNGPTLTNTGNVAVRLANANTTSIPPSAQMKSEALKRIRVNNPPQDFSRLHTIPEYNDPLRRDSAGAYTVKIIIIEKEVMHCINMNPHKSEPYVVILQEFMAKFFPSVSIYPTAVSVIRSCGIQTYLPNAAQIRIMNAYGYNIQFAWQIPLIPVLEVTKAMNKLKSVFRPRDASANILNTSNSRSNGYVNGPR